MGLPWGPTGLLGPDGAAVGLLRSLLGLLWGCCGVRWSCCGAAVGPAAAAVGLLWVPTRAAVGRIGAAARPPG